MLRRSAALALGLIALACCTTTDHGPDVVAAKASTALTWAPASTPIHIRTGQTSTLLGTGDLLIAGGGSTPASSEIVELVRGRTVSGPTMLAPRTGHTATMLLTGKVLLTGGAAIPSAEVYDPLNRTTTATGVPAQARTNAVAIRLRSGSVLVIGGLGTSDSSSELYDPTTGAWSAVPDRQGSNVATAATRADGTVFVVSLSATSIEVYDPATPAAPWVPFPGAIGGVDATCTTTRLSDGRIIIGRGTGCFSVGGPGTCMAQVVTYLPAGQGSPGMLTQGNNFIGTASLFGAVRLVTDEVVFDGDNLNLGASRYNATTKTMTNDGALGSLHTLPSMTVVPGGDVFVVGGSQAAIDRRTATGTWSQPAGLTLATGRKQATAVRLHDGRVLVAGGVARAGNTATAEIVDASAGSVTSAPSMAIARVGHTMTALGDGSVLVAGGGTAAAERFLPGSPATFATLSPMTVSRTGHTAVRLPSGKVLVVGGDAGGTAELFDPVAGTFAALPTPTTVKGDGAKSAVLLPNGRVLLVGGAAAEVFEPTTSTFRVVARPGASREGTTARLLSSGKVFLAGGSTLAAETFDPLPETWAFTDAPALQSLEMAVAALPDGRLLAAGGRFGGEGVSAVSRIFDPLGRATGSFIDTTALPEGVYRHAMVTAGSGDVVVLGGDACYGVCVATPNAQVQVYSDGAPLASRPTITSAPAEVVAGTRVTVAGTGFANGSEAASGTTASSATNHPLVYWVSDANDGVVPGTVVDFTDTRATWLVPPTALYGHGQLFVAVAGVMSRGAGVTIAPALAATACENDAQCAAGFCVDGVCCDRACDGACEGCSAAHKLSGADGVCGAVPPGQDIYGRCVLKLGDTCTTKTECGPNFCARASGDSIAVCCDSACEGQCLSCNLSGKAGSCSAINEGACGAACDGAHTLKQVGSPDHDCTPFTCAGMQCNASCASVRDCVAPAVCNLEGQCVPAVTPSPGAEPVFGCTVTPRRAPPTVAGILGLGLAALGVRRRRHR